MIENRCHLDFLSSITNIGWILGVPILSSIIVGGLFCLIGANDLRRVAIDDARMAPGTVAAIWLFLGIFFILLRIPESAGAAFVLTIGSDVLVLIHFAFWGLAEGVKHEQQEVSNNRDQKNSHQV